jgi:predicted dehydrogenase
VSLTVGPIRARTDTRAPRVGFLGVGWIGRQRMLALAEAGLVQAAAVADTDAPARAAAAEALPGIATVDDLPALLEADLDGLAIATPSALHAEQAIAALDRGIAVFCQKPLARTAAETRAVVDAARRADRLLGVDLSYRHLSATALAHEAIARGDLGQVYAVDLVFHNGYGPDKPWFTTRRLSGGGCLVDLGTHLVDLALWLTGARTATVDSARLLVGGGPVDADPRSDQVEDFALAQLRLDGRATARIACSWFLPVGAECEVSFTVYGTEGAIAIRNVDGSFYDFVAHRHRGTASELLTEGRDAWGARAISAWGTALAQGGRFDPEVDRVVALAEVLDAIYTAART